MFQPKTSFRLLSAAALLIGFSSVTCFAQEHAFRDDAESKRLPLSGSSAAAYQRYDT